MCKSVSRYCAILAAASFLFSALGAPEADAISLPKKMADGKVCRFEFSDPHIHAANGARPDKTDAQRKAIHDWSRFTAFEYGRRWADWSYAIQHSMTCMHDTDAGVWRCRAEAQPCRTDSQVAFDRAGSSKMGCGFFLSLSCIQRFMYSTFTWRRY